MIVLFVLTAKKLHAFIFCRTRGMFGHVSKSEAITDAKGKRKKNINHFIDKQNESHSKHTL